MPTIDQRNALDTLTKAELVEAVAATTNVLKQDAEIFVTVVLETMVEALQDGSRIELRGFGSFGLRRYEERATCADVSLVRKEATKRV